MSKLFQFLSRLTKSVPEGHEYFSGSYHGGDAEYTYKPSGDEKIFDGDFKYYMKMGGGKFRKVHGTFKEDLKDGTWEFEQKGNTTHKRLSIQFSEGAVAGTLNTVSEEVTMAALREATLNMNISDGKVKGKFTGSFRGGDIIGYCDDEGYPDGVWTHTIKDGGESHYVRTEVWNHGHLSESFEENLRRKTKTPMPVNLRDKVNAMIETDCYQLLDIIKRGTVGDMIQIPYIKG